MYDDTDGKAAEVGAYLFIVGVVVLCLIVVAALIAADPVGKAAHDAMRAEQHCYLKGC